MSFFDLFKKRKPPSHTLTVSKVREAICDKGFLEVCEYWEAAQKSGPSIGLLLGMNQRLYELALTAPDIPMEHRKLSLNWADEIGQGIEGFFASQNNQAGIDAFRKAVDFMKSTGDINRP